MSIGRLWGICLYLIGPLKGSTSLYLRHTCTRTVYAIIRSNGSLQYQSILVEPSIAPWQTKTHTWHASDSCLLRLKPTLWGGCASAAKGVTGLWLYCWVLWFSRSVLRSDMKCSLLCWLTGGTGGYNQEQDNRKRWKWSLFHCSHP